MHGLEKSFKPEELKLNGREISSLEKTSESEINILKIKEKKELLLAWNELKDLGANQKEIDSILPRR